MREDNREHKNSGFTLVEVLIAVAILAVVAIPVIQSFVSVAQVNGKSRRRLAAMTVAESVMEACKSMTLVEFAAQCGYFNDSNVPFTIVSGEVQKTGGVVSISNFSGTAAELKIKNSKLATLGDTSDENKQKTALPIASGAKQFKLNPDNNTDKYYFWIGQIKMGGGLYDAVVTYTLNTSRTSTNTSTYDPYNDLSKAGLRTLQYYDIKIEVYRSLSTFNDTVYGIDSVQVVTLEGSITDYIEPNSRKS